MSKKLFYVGQYKSGKPPETVWEFQGVFDTRKKAVKACRTDKYFVIEIILNKQLPDETVIPKTYWPHQDVTN